MHRIVRKRWKNMKTNTLILLLVFVWVILMANIIWEGTNGKWRIEDVEKIAMLEAGKYTNQMVVVAVTKDDAELCFYEYVNDRGMKVMPNENSGQWNLVFETEARIGKNGIGKTKEGDGKTPIGVYRFIKAFGILENFDTKMEYTKIGNNHYWVDDGKSNYYNQFIEIEKVKKDWSSAEHLCEYGESYHYVLATSYNVEGIPGKGSAVFLHCMSNESGDTAGCIAIPEIYMKNLLKEIEAQCVLIIDQKERILNY